jgi:hypothetical protein
MIKSEKRPIVIGIGDNTPIGKKRDINLARNILAMTYVLQFAKESKDYKLGIVIGNTHVDSVKYLIEKYSDMKIDNIKEIGKPFYECDIFNFCDDVKSIDSLIMQQELTNIKQALSINC